MINMIKIQLELPEFEKELNVSVTLKKDGEVITTSSSSPEVKTEISDSGNAWKQFAEPVKEEKTRNKKSSGNMMDISI